MDEETKKTTKDYSANKRRGRRGKYNEDYMTNQLKIKTL